MIDYREIRVVTHSERRMIDITGMIQSELEVSPVFQGMALIFVPGATGAVSTIEYEPGLQHDFPELMEKLIPEQSRYHHNETWGDGNGHSHLRATLMGPSLTIPVRGGQLMLGRWQQIVFLEFDNRPRDRRLVIQFMGEEA